MKKIHVNPATGEVSACPARIKCTFSGDSGTENHYDTRNEANKAAEKIHQRLAEEEKSETQRRKQLAAAYALYGKNISPFTISYSPEVNRLVSALRAAGLRPLLAGGAIRDAVVNNTDGSVIDFKDLDFEVYPADRKNTTITSENITHKLVTAARTVGNVDEVGKAFGVLKMTLKDGTEIDLSLPRKESKEGTGHKGFVVTPDVNLTVEEASARRDFTLNSMLYDDEHKVIIDSHNGLDDLKNKRLRHTSEAFAEDPLRVLRGFQFASRFGFSIDDRTKKLSSQLFSEYDTISSERVQVEWDKWAAKGQQPSAGLKVLRDTGWDKGFTGLERANNERTHTAADTAARLSNENGTDRRVVLPAVVLSQIDAETPKKRYADRRAFVNKTIIGKSHQNQAVSLAETADDDYAGIKTADIVTTADAKLAALQNKTSLEERVVLSRALATADGNAEVQAHLERAERVIAEAGVWDKPEEDLVSGNDVLDISGRKPGRWMSPFLYKVKEAQAREEFTTPEEGRAWIRAHLSEDS